MHELLTFTIIGIVTGAAYAVAASGLVVTYATSGVFNIAHGAIGMLMAFVYWQLVVPWHVPQVAALVLTIGVFAPLLGALVEVVLIRRTRGNTLAVVLVVTVGLMVLLIGIADYVWGQTTAVAPVFFGGHGFHLAGVAVTWQQAITVLAGIGIAAGLRLLLYRTRLGVGMRAVVDNRDLAALNGARPAWIGTVSWALGAALAALAGILIAPTLQLNVLNLSLLVLDAYAAAIVGRLRNLPATFAGAIGLGLIGSYLVGYLPTGGFWGSTPMQGLHIAYPVLALFVVLLVLPSDTIERGRATMRRAATHVPSLGASVAGGLAMVAVVFALTSFLQSGDVLRLGLGMASGLVMLSLVPLTGWAGPVSLCQMTFAGLGAFAMARLGHGGDVLGLAAAVALAGAVGVVVALPALRLRGLYLALATMAFATLMDNMVFPSSAIFTFDGSVAVARPSLFGLHITGNQAYVVFLAAVFALLSVGLLALRRGPFGRLLGAVKDSEAACATLGLNLTTTKLSVFALSAGLAGLAGALFGGMQTTAGATDFEMLQSLPVLLLVVLYGVSTTSGAFVGGLSLGLIYVVEAHVPSLSSLQYIATGLAGVTLGFYPEGVVPGVAARLRGWWTTLTLATAGDFPPPALAAAGAGSPVVAAPDYVHHEPAVAVGGTADVGGAPAMGTGPASVSAGGGVPVSGPSRGGDPSPERLPDRLADRLAADATGVVPAVAPVAAPAPPAGAAAPAALTAPTGPSGPPTPSAAPPPPGVPTPPGIPTPSGAPPPPGVPTPPGIPTPSGAPTPPGPSTPPGGPMPPTTPTPAATPIWPSVRILGPATDGRTGNASKNQPHDVPVGAVRPTRPVGGSDTDGDGTRSGSDVR